MHGEAARAGVEVAATLRQDPPPAKDYDLLKAQMIRLALFSNKIFFK